MTPRWQIPPSVLRGLEECPRGRPVALLLRHSVRDALPDDSPGNLVPITAAGMGLAEELGEALRGRLASLHASPILRCMQTARCIGKGAGEPLDVTPNRLLGDPGVYVLDGEQAWRNWQQRGHEGVMGHLLTGDEALTGMARPAEAARFLVQHMLTLAGDTPGVHVFVTHDSVLAATAARLGVAPISSEGWPWFLEAAFFWTDQRGINSLYRRNHATRAEPLCGLGKDDVIEFARREIARTVGLESGARFFLAGGAFKSLLTGRAPRDLDLWATSDADRSCLIAALKGRGAKPIETGPYCDAFEVEERVVEVPHRVAPSELEERLARFDIGLSAVGVEHAADGSWRAVVAPLAAESVRRQEVLLLKPLVNWKYALSTLERALRYADELGYSLPDSEVEAVWTLFDGQSSEMQRGMIRRYQLTGRGRYGLLEQARARLQ